MLISGIRFVTWHRPSVNLSLGEKWTKKDLDELRFANCLRCNCRFEKDLLIALCICGNQATRTDDIDGDNCDAVCRKLLVPLFDNTNYYERSDRDRAD